MPSIKPPLFVSVVGTSGSGKTATIVYLTAELTKLGFRVGVAKHIHREGFTIDTEGKDTWKHAKAGAKIVIGASPNELAIITKTVEEANFEQICEIFRAQDLDLVLLEGFSTARKGKIVVHKILAAKNRRDLDYTLAKASPPILAITGLVARSLRRVRKIPAPVVDIQREGPILTTRIRRLLRPNEINHILKKASVKHGGTCIGLAMGVRAAYIASSAFGSKPSSPNQITCGTKLCIAEAFKTLYPKSRIGVLKIRNHQIVVSSNHEKLMIQLARKRKFTEVNEVLTVPDSDLFDSVSFTRR